MSGSNIPLGVQVPQPPDMLQSALRMGALANYANQNKLFQAHQAAGQIAQQAIDPETGLLDTTKANRLLAGAGPDVALAAQDMLQANEARASGNMKLATARLGVIGNALDALRWSKEPLTKERVLQTMENLRTLGFQIPDMSAQMPDDPDALRDRANTAAEQVRGIEERIKQGQGAVGGVNAGTGTQFMQTQYPPGSGQPTMRPVAGGFVPDRSVVEFKGPQNQPVTTLRSDAPDVIRQQSGQPSALPPGLRNPNRPGAAAPTAGGGGAGAPAAIVGPTPQQQAAASATGTAAAGSFQDVAAQGQRAVVRGSVIDNMLADKTGFVSGPGTEGTKKVQATIQAWSPRLGAALGIDPKRVAATESFDKLAAQLADAQGAGSDARLQVTQAATPNSSMSDQGVDFILRQLRGNEDYFRARAALAAKQADTGDYRGFEADVGSKLDPRVYQYARLRPEQRTDYYKAVEDKAAFKRAEAWARANAGLTYAR